MKSIMLASVQTLAALFIAACLAPVVAHAVEPVEQIRRALKIDPGVGEIDVQKAAERRALIEQAMPDLKTINQLRRAYFLKEWVLHGRPDKLDKIDINSFRVQIGKKLIEKVRAAASEANNDRQIAVARMIAELAASDEPADRSPTGKFASAFTDLLVGGKDSKGLVEHPDIYVRQSALDALGKITPKPAAAKPA